MKILITGAQGYIGSLLVERFLNDARISQVVATDMNQPSEAFLRQRASKSLFFERGRLDDPDTMKKISRYIPIDIVVHAAFRIRPGYGRRAKEVEDANLKSCENVFRFCFENNVKKLIYFSTASVYGANPRNTKEHFFNENEPLRERTFPYGLQKRKVEEMLRELWAASQPRTNVVIVRPCGITGPRGQHESGKKISLIAFLRRYLPFIPKVTDEWTRQFVHEQDVVSAIEFLTFSDLPGRFEVFNLAPNDYLTANDIGKILGKKVIPVPAWLMNLGFTVLWHVTRGKMPSPPGSINFYKYPINLDGRKITKLGFQYKYSSRDALLAEKR